MPFEPDVAFAKDLHVEVEQSYDQGLDVDREAAHAEAKAIMDLPPGPAREEKALAFHDRLAALPMRGGYPYEEPSDWDAIRALLAPEQIVSIPAKDRLRDRIRGAWYGRIAGCLVGKPFEGWRSDRYYPFLKETGQYPLSYYADFTVTPEMREKYGVADIAGNEYLRAMSRGRIDGMIEDDDTNYTVLGLKLLEEKGRGFTPDDAAMHWLGNLPLFHVYTAERVAYRNLVRQIAPPASATYANPFREWIGAQIRADFFGYANPGRPFAAAEMAWRDACISHVKNGIYGEMYMAAAIALALTSDDLEQVLRGALDYIPPRSRLREGIEEVMTWPRKYDFAQAYAEFHRRWDEKQGHHWCHTISNAQIVVLALLYGEGDFGRTVCRAVDLLLDTDCNGATAGSIFGALHGEKAVPDAWKEPLHDKLRTGVAGFNLVSIAEMAERTLRIVEKS